MHLLTNLYVLVYEISRSLVVLPVIASSGNFKLNVIRGSTDVDTAFCGYNNRFVSTATKDCDETHTQTHTHIPTLVWGDHS